ncbi:MAG: aminoacyl-tRNA hydrolase [Alphaproteobacteria bacterium]|nr:aminoacyl-tRNA hydrolase [Alphaproteobacteria bacterium]
MTEPTRCKQVLLYRRDLQMRKGKIAAQCAHASLAVFLRRQARAVAVAVDDAGQPLDALDPATTLVLPLTADMASWVRAGSAKVVLSVEDEAALLTAHRLAQEAGLPCALIRDSGRTEFGGVPTYTAVAIGPARLDLIDPITGPDGAVATKLA